MWSSIPSGIDVCETIGRGFEPKREVIPGAYNLIGTTLKNVRLS